MPDQPQQPSDDSIESAAREARATPAGNTATTPPLDDDIAAQAAALTSDTGLAELREEAAKWKDQALRAQADAQNTRRRADQEVAKVRKFALESFAESLLPVLDSLEAALAIDQATAEQLREGTDATHRQLLAALGRNQVAEISPAPGDKFNPDQQHAISAVADSGQPAGTIVAVLQKGYLIAERVLRPALVSVAKAE